ncbi:Hypothetical protein POVR1_LOCUS362 [uncultured virus]|nr:Hypothetical protein POVR1_LOCUS362 [uncultured virus]
MGEQPQFLCTNRTPVKSFEMAILNNTIRFRTDGKPSTFMHLDAVKSDGTKLVHTFRFASSEKIHVIESNEDPSCFTSPWTNQSPSDTKEAIVSNVKGQNQSSSIDTKKVNSVDDLKEFYGVYLRSISIIGSGSYSPRLIKTFSTCEKARKWIENAFIEKAVDICKSFDGSVCLYIAETTLENYGSTSAIYDLTKASYQKFPTYAFTVESFGCLFREHYNNCSKVNKMEYPYWLRMIDCNADQRQLNGILSCDIDSVFMSKAFTSENKITIAQEHAEMLADPNTFLKKKFSGTPYA